MTVVVDASVLVAALVDDADTGEWSARALRANPLAAPELVLFEAANVLRRLSSGGILSVQLAGLAHHDLLLLDLTLWPYGALAQTAWARRGSLSMYDASYIALAVQLDVPLVTLDERLARTARRSCAVVTPASAV